MNERHALEQAGWTYTATVMFHAAAYRLDNRVIVQAMSTRRWRAWDNNREASPWLESPMAALAYAELHNWGRS